MIIVTLKEDTDCLLMVKESESEKHKDKDLGERERNKLGLSCAKLRRS